MKIRISQTELALVLEVADSAVPSRPASPILANFLLIADSNTQQLTIAAFDLSLGIRAESKCNVEGSGQIAIRAKLLVDVVSQLPKSDITLEVKDNFVVLTHPTGKCQIQTTSSDEFPKLPEIDGIPVALPVTKLQQLLKATLFAASHDQTKQIIAGVHFKLAASNYELAATDGHRLAVASTTKSNGSLTDPELVEATIPYQSLTELEKLLNNVSKSGNCTVSIGKTIAIFDLPDNNIRLTTRLLEGQYPPYPALIPQQFQYQFKINKQALDSALKRLMIVAEDKNNTAKFVFDIKGQCATISAESHALGGAVESVAISSLSDSGDNLKLGFNLKYLINALKYIPSTEIIINANRPTTPVIVTPVGSSLKQLVLVMPLELMNDLEIQKTQETLGTETTAEEALSTAVGEALEASPETIQSVPEAN